MLTNKSPSVEMPKVYRPYNHFASSVVAAGITNLNGRALNSNEPRRSAFKSVAKRSINSAVRSCANPSLSTLNQSSSFLNPTSGQNMKSVANQIDFATKQIENQCRKKKYLINLANSDAMPSTASSHKETPFEQLLQLKQQIRKGNTQHPFIEKKKFGALTINER